MQQVRYFDGNATTPLCREARKSWEEASDTWWYNSSSPFSLGSAVNVRIEKERDVLASLLGTECEEIVFNSGATEGNNYVFWAWGRTCPADKVVLLSSIEHPSVLQAAKFHLGNRLVEIPVSREGLLDYQSLKDYIGEGNVWGCSVMAANNETGVLQSWVEVRDLCQSQGVAFHTDAAQWIGKLPASDLGKCDLVTGCAHKFGGPKGVGFLKLSRAIGSDGFYKGGEQEGGFRAGTQDYPSISSMMAALISHETLLPEARNQFEDKLKGTIPDVIIVGSRVPRLAQTSMIILPRYENHRWVTLLSKRGFLVSTGSACSSTSEDGSLVLKAMGYGDDETKRAVRISGGRWNSPGDWDDLAIAFEEVWRELEEKSAGISNVISLD